MKKHLFYIIFVFLLFSCGESAQKKENVLAALPVLDLEAAFDNIDEADTSFLWNDIITNERFIPLETTDECLIGNGILYSAIPLGNHYLVFNKITQKEPVLLFDSSGHFIKRFIWPGKGPGELSSIVHHVVPFKNDQHVMFVTDYEAIIKDKNGTLIHHFRSDSLRPLMYLYPHDSGFVFVNQYERFPGDSTFLGFTDSLVQIVKELKEAGEKRPDPDENRQIMLGLDSRDIFFTDDHFWFMKSYNDTLFRITPQRNIEPYLVLYRGKYIPSLPEKEKKLSFGDYKEIGKYSIITTNLIQIWNRDTQKLVAQRKNNPFGFMALAVFNYRFPDGYVMPLRLMEIKNGKLIFLFTPTRYKGNFLKLKEDDNPVIMVAELKKES